MRKSKKRGRWISSAAYYFDVSELLLGYQSNDAHGGDHQSGKHHGHGGVAGLRSSIIGTGNILPQAQSVVTHSGMSLGGFAADLEGLPDTIADAQGAQIALGILGVQQLAAAEDLPDSGSIGGNTNTGIAVVHPQVHTAGHDVVAVLGGNYGPVVIVTAGADSQEAAILRNGSRMPLSAICYKKCRSCR